MSATSIDRRQFLKLTAAAFVAGIGIACGDADQNTLGRPQLLEMLGPDRVRTLGAHYRASVPDENSAEALRAAISSAPSELHLPWIHKSMGDAVSNDFAAGRTVLVDGWVLSVTEARQCALFSLAA